MAAAAQPQTRGLDRPWEVARRWQEYEGEGRANLLRLVGVVVFYLVELINYHGLRLGVLEMPPVVDLPFHRVATALAGAWILLVLGVLVCRLRHVFPASLKFLSTGCDLLFLTALLMAGDGEKSPLIVAYFLVLAVAALRFSLQLMWFTTAGALASYLFLLAYGRWFAERDLRVPRYHQLIVVCALVLGGVVLGQVVRRARRLAEDFARRRLSVPGGKP
jgi:hypothetical protein